MELSLPFDTVFFNPIGLPIAITSSPFETFEESYNFNVYYSAKCRFAFSLKRFLNLLNVQVDS